MRFKPYRPTLETLDKPKCAHSAVLAGPTISNMDLWRCTLCSALWLIRDGPDIVAGPIIKLDDPENFAKLTAKEKRWIGLGEKIRTP